jgi:alkylation response protein AidB-like acyl-CoA dehydrogenase
MPSILPAGHDHPDPEGLHRVATALELLADRTAAEGPWASGALRMLADEGVLAGFVPADVGGTAADEPALVALLVAVAERCLTTALALSQWAAAVRIIAAGPTAVRARYLPALARGATFTTVGVSQLTTSRQHVGRPVLTADRSGGCWRLTGLCPWVTGADRCSSIVTGAATDTGGRMFFVVPTEADGVAIDPPLELLALAGSRTSVVRMTDVVPDEAIEAGPDAPRTGGLATTALALGAARGSTAVVAREARGRSTLAAVARGLADETAALAERLTRAARDGAEPSIRDRLRSDATGLATRAGQAALVASKGAGFVHGHRAERLVRESLFFLVWSCPESVTAQVLCTLAGLE